MYVSWTGSRAAEAKITRAKAILHYTQIIFFWVPQKCVKGGVPVQLNGWKLIFVSIIFWSGSRAAGVNITRAKAITQYTQAQIEVICKETKKEAVEGLHLQVMEFLNRAIKTDHFFFFSYKHFKFMIRTSVSILRFWAFHIMILRCESKSIKLEFQTRQRSKQMKG